MCCSLEFETKWDRGHYMKGVELIDSVLIDCEEEDGKP